MFTREEFTKTLEAVVKGKEDYVYKEEHESCRYAIDGKPACLIGHVLHKLGILGTAREGASAYFVLKPYLDEDTRHAAMVAQREQDTGGTWGAALDTYREEIASYDSARAFLKSLANS